MENVVVLSEESYKEITVKMLDELLEKGGPTLGLAAILIFARLRGELFHKESEAKEEDHELHSEDL